MKIFLPRQKMLVSIIFLLSFFTTFAQSVELPSGAFIVNMGVTPQTYGNGIKPWGMIHDLIKNYKVQVKWVISPTKGKDGIDFSYNGTNFKGGTFIIPYKYRTAAVNARIAYWQTQGVIGITTTSTLTVDVTYNLKYSPRWTFDFQNGDIALDFLAEAGIPSGEYPKKYPSELNTCDDLFVMPHADPTWSTHSNLLAWNQSNRGWIWAGCHAVSVLENLVNPADTSQKMNFLSQSGLVMFDEHDDGNPPYQYRFPNDGEMQFMGKADLAMQNGSEQIFLPKINTWRPTTKVAAYNNTHPEVPALSPGEAAAIVYGRAFGDNDRGKVMYEGGHDINKGMTDAVSAMRAFFNFSYLSVYDKAINPTIIGPINLTSLTSYSYRAVLPVANNSNNYTYRWTSSCGGVFSSPFDSVTLFTAPLVTSCTNCTIFCTVSDGCGREYYQEYEITICSTLPPVALDRITPMITNPDGTGPQPIGSPVPLAGTDEDGYVVTYILTSLPTNGVLFYDHDNNTATADISINSLPGGELVLTAQKMKTIKFDPADGFAGNASFQYTVADNSGLRDLSPATYTIPVNPPPVALTKICTPVGSNAAKSVACNMEATDNGTIISYTITALPPASQCTVYINNVDAYVGQVLTPLQATQITFKPSGLYVGYSEIMYTATDNNGAVDPTPATLTLQMINQPPFTADLSANTILNPTGTTRYAMPALTATDKDGSVVNYYITAAPTTAQGKLYYYTGSNYAPAANHQTLTLAQAATLKFDPADNFSGVASFQYTAKDNLGLVDNTPSKVNIPVQVSLPVAKDTINQSVYSGAGWVGIYNLSGTSAGSSIVSYQVLTVPDATTEGRIGFGASNTIITPGMTLTPSQAANMKFEPLIGFSGVASFTYTCTNGASLTDMSPAIVKLPVHNNPPEAIDKQNSAVLASAGLVSITSFSATDSDQGSISGHSFIITSLPASSLGVLYVNSNPAVLGQTITAAQGSTLKFDPISTARDTAVFSYTVTDECGLADATPATFRIPITAVLSAPVCNDINMSPISVRQVANPIPALSATDIDGTIDHFYIQTIQGSFGGTIYLEGNILSNGSIIPYEKRNQLYIIPYGTSTGAGTFKFRAVDNDGLTSGLATFSVSIVSSGPEAKNITMRAVKQITTVKIAALKATDADGVIASFKITSLPTLGNTLQCDLAGTNSFTNVSNNQTLTIAQASRLRIIFNATLGLSSFTYTATDNSGTVSNVATYSIPVEGNAANQLPDALDRTNPSIVMNAGVTTLSTLLATDLDGTIASYTIVNVPPSYYGRLMYNTGGSNYDSILIGNKPITTAQAATLKFLPSGVYAGNVTFTYTAKDDDNAVSDLATFTIPVSCPDPVAIDLNNSAVSSSAGPVLLQSLEGTSLGNISGFYITDLPLNTQGVLVMDGSVVSTDQFIPSMYANRLEFDPQPSFVGTASFRYTAVDNSGDFDKTPATVTVPVTNSAPFAKENISQVITNTIGTTAQALPALTGYDNDGTIASYTIKTLPTNGVLYVNGAAATINQALTPAQAAQLSFDPVDNFAGSTSFTFTVKDNSNLNSGTAVYTIVSNLPPISFNVLNPGMTPGQPLTPLLPLMASDDGSIVSYTILTLPSVIDGALYLNNVPVTLLSQVSSLNAAQITQLQFLPTANFSGAIFSYTATDNLGIVDVTPAIYEIPFGNSGTLPIQLAAFAGNKSGADNILVWTTSQEQNASHFELERSTDGSRYNKIATVSAKGNSTSANDYSYADKNITDAVLYYRLKMVDIDGSFKYSKIVVLKRDQKGVYISTIAPNPFSDRVMIDLVTETKGTTQLMMYSSGGTLVKSIRVNTVKGMNHIELTDLSGLSTGMYILRIANNDETIDTKLMKAH